MAYRLKSWSDFPLFLDTQVFAEATANNSYIWRGQRRNDWSLSTSLDRLFEQIHPTGDPSKLEALSKQHLAAFTYAARGRRGINPPKLTENEWWALGQHYGLATPLLDWTHSPFAAAYFAFEELAPDATPYRVVFGLDQLAVEELNMMLQHGPSVEKGRVPVIDFVDPLSDENLRLVSQGGLFTRAPIGLPIEMGFTNL